MSLFTLQKLIGITAKLSDVLQAEQLDFIGAADFVTATLATLKGLRNVEEWDGIWSKATTKVGSSKEMRHKNPTKPDVGAGLFQWFTAARAQGIPISGEILN